MSIHAFVLLAITLGNTEVPQSWTGKEGMPLSECTPEQAQRPADSWEVMEAVESGSVGQTCSFNPGGTAHPAMPPVYTQLYLLAASQTLYHGKWVEAEKDKWKAACEHQKFSYSEAESGEGMCGWGCGQCFVVTGPSGSAVWIINEIADINAVGDNGQGLNLHLDDDHRPEVRPGGGVAKDVQAKRVPCPTEGYIHVTVLENFGTSALFFGILNHRIGVVALHLRGTGPGANTTWVPLTRDWTNRWHWESYGCPTCVPWQEGPVSRGGSGFEFKVISVEGEEVKCTGMSLDEVDDKQEKPTWECVDAGQPQQFLCPGDDMTGCDGGGLANKELYKKQWTCPGPVGAAVTAVPSTGAPQTTTDAPQIATDAPQTATGNLHISTSAPDNNTSLEQERHVESGELEEKKDEGTMQVLVVVGVLVFTVIVAGGGYLLRKSMTKRRGSMSFEEVRRVEQRIMMLETEEQHTSV